MPRAAAEGGRVQLQCSSERHKHTTSIGTCAATRDGASDDAQDTPRAGRQHCTAFTGTAIVNGAAGELCGRTATHHDRAST
eukprot:6711298-Prymnesium_polylepis.1